MLADALVKLATVPTSLPLPTLGLFSFKIPPLVLDQGSSKAWRKHINWSEGWGRENQWPQVLQPHLLFFLSSSCHFCQGPSAGWDINSGSSLSIFSAVTFLQGHIGVYILDTQMHCWFSSFTGRSSVKVWGPESDCRGWFLVLLGEISVNFLGRLFAYCQPERSLTPEPGPFLSHSPIASSSLSSFLPSFFPSYILSFLLSSFPFPLFFPFLFPIWDQTQGLLHSRKISITKLHPIPFSNAIFFWHWQTGKNTRQWVNITPFWFWFPGTFYFSLSLTLISRVLWTLSFPLQNLIFTYIW